MSSPLIHPDTLRRLDALMHDTPQSLLLQGPEGVGFSGIIEYLAEALKVKPLIVLPEKDEKVDIEKGTLSVAVIRRLYDQTKSISQDRRIIVIDYAERMGTQAQNAFLKLLEEPNPNTHFILLTHSPQTLLATITSRTQAVDIKPITDQQTTALITTLTADAQKQAQLRFIAAGLPAELTRLGQDEAYFDKRVSIVKDARTLLQGEAYEKLQVAQRYRDSRTAALTVLSDCAKLLQKSLVDGNDPSIVKKMSLFLDAYDRIQANGNVRLHLAAVVV